MVFATTEATAGDSAHAGHRPGGGASSANRAPQYLTGLETLPGEILCMISLQLHVPDILNCRIVCRNWRLAWSQPSVISYICRYRFPGLLEMNPTSDLLPLFVDAGLGYIRRRRDQKHWGSSTIDWDIYDRECELGSDTAPRSMSTLEPVYERTTVPRVCCGDDTVAWQNEGDQTVFVDRLHESTHLCIDPHRGATRHFPLRLEAATDKILVLSREDPEAPEFALHVINIDNRRHKTVALPGPLEFCYVRDDRIAAVTSTGKVVAWGWDIKYHQVDAGFDIKNNVIRGDYDLLPGVLFHPTQTDVLYIVRSRRCVDEDKNSFTLVVAKCQNGEAIQTFEKKMSLPVPHKDYAEYDAAAERLFGDDDDDYDDDYWNHYYDDDDHYDDGNDWESYFFDDDDDDNDSGHNDDDGDDDSDENSGDSEDSSELGLGLIRPDYRKPLLSQPLFSSSSVSTGRSCQQMNSYGLYSLAVLETGPWRQTWGCPTDMFQMADIGKWCSVCFNVITETFVVYHYQPTIRKRKTSDHCFQEWEPYWNIAPATATLIDDELILEYVWDPKDDLADDQYVQDFRVCQVDHQTVQPGYGGDWMFGEKDRGLVYTDCVRLRIHSNENRVITTSVGGYEVLDFKDTIQGIDEEENIWTIKT